MTCTISPLTIDVLASDMTQLENEFQEAKRGMDAVAGKCAASAEFIQAVQVYADSYERRDKQVFRVIGIAQQFGSYSEENRSMLLVGSNFVLLAKEEGFVRVIPCAELSH